MSPQLKQTVLEFIQRSQSRPFGLAGEYLLKADDPLQVADFFNVTYGAKVWDSLNSQRKFFNLLRHNTWGNVIGWRIRSARNAQSKPIGEIEALPDVGKQTYQSVYSLPRQVVTPVGSSELAQWIATKEGGIGDAMAKELQFGEIDHVKELQQELLCSAVDVVKTAGLTGVAAVSNPSAFRIGDILWESQNAAAGGILLTAINTTTGVIGFTLVGGGAAAALVQSDAITVKSRKGMTSLDDIIEEDGRTVAGANNQNVDCYNFTAATPGGATRTALAYNAGNVFDGDGVPRDFDTDYVDEAIERVRFYGGEPDLLLTGTDQQRHFKQALQAQRRYMETGDFQVKRGGEENIPGQRAGFQVSTYDGIALFADVDTPKSTKADFTLAGSNFYVLDTRWLEVGVAFTTEYFEQRDPIIVGKLAIVGLFRTTMELKCYDFRKQAKIVDLN
jgi:hypothetical protein